MTEKEIIKRAFRQVAPSDELIEKTIAQSGSQSVPLIDDAYNGSPLSDLNYGGSAIPAAPRRAKSPRGRRRIPVPAIAGGVCAAAIVAAAPLIVKNVRRPADSISEAPAASYAESNGNAATASMSDESYIEYFLTNVPFTATAVRADRLYSGTEQPRFVWITNAKELSEYQENNKERFSFDSTGMVGTNRCFNDFIRNYDEEFFRKHNLLMLLVEEESENVFDEILSIEHTMSSLDRIQGRLTVTLGRYEPPALIDKPAQWHIVMELDKKYSPDTCDVGLEIKDTAWKYDFSEDRVYADDSAVPDSWLRVASHAEAMSSIMAILSADTSENAAPEDVITALMNRNLLAFEMMWFPNESLEIDWGSETHYSADTGVVTIYPLKYTSQKYFSDVKKVYKLFNDTYESDYAEDLLSGKALKGKTLFYELDGKYYVDPEAFPIWTGDAFMARSYVEITEKTDSEIRFVWHYPDIEGLNKPEEYEYFYYHRGEYTAVLENGFWKLSKVIFDNGSPDNLMPGAGGTSGAYVDIDD